MADLQELFARLKSQGANQTDTTQTPAQPSLWAPHQQQPSPHRQPSVSSPLFSPPVSTPNPIHSSNIISPVNPSSTVGSPAPDSNRTNNLLNLLKFNNQGGGPQSSGAGAMANLQNVSSRPQSMHVPQIQQREGSDSRPLSAMQRSTSNLAGQSPMAAAGTEKSDNQSGGNQQDFLLNLLTRPNKSTPATSRSPKPTEEAVVQSIEKEDQQDPAVDALTQNLAQTSVQSATKSSFQRESTPVRQFGSPAPSSTPFEAPQPTKPSMFSYVNPFDQLSSSSPLNRTPRPEAQAEIAHAVQPKKIEILKHNRDVSSNQNGESSGPAWKSRKLEAEDTPSAATENKSQQSVSQALEDVGEQVDKQASQALAQAETKPITSAPPSGTNNESVPNKTTSGKDDVESSWESAEDSADKEEKDFQVEVFNLPMKPFVSLQIKQTKQARPFRQKVLLRVAVLKKEFDQIDRCLVTASPTHIVYAQPATKKDNGGFRILRQDSGDHKQVFRLSGERIFSVQLCSAAVASHDVEAVLGTGVNGSVFWTSLAKSRGDLFHDDDVEAQGFIMPPVQTTEENTSGSPVKTRAKMSSRHPEYFAIARGKQIFIVQPDAVKDKAYCDPNTRKVNSDKYFAEHSLKINTAKAGKDFCFSEDDSVIVSLDKNGRFKFWDIRELTARASGMMQDKHEPVELREPIWTMNAAASGSKADEKPSVSSIMFLDKDRAINKGSALRYMIIGFKQNHILQLWDLGLAKAVQEIRLPHEKDSDGICSITYHPKTGIIAVGHPTRNSIYFIHLSAPKYNLPHMEQAKYISMLCRKDLGLPTPDSTAIMSGLREYSFAKVGQLRSLDMLRSPEVTDEERNTLDETVFELYCMHSKGVIVVSIKKPDLGWDVSSKMVNPKDARKEGVIETNDLIQPHKLPNSSEQSSGTGTEPKQVQKPEKATTKKADAPKTEAKPEAGQASSPAAASAANGLPRMASPEPPARPLPQVPLNPPLVTPESYANAAQRAKSSNHQDQNAAERKKMIVSPRATQPTPVATSVTPSSDSAEMQTALSKQFEILYQRIDADKRVQDAATGAKQDALLRLVSSTLTENVDRTLSSIIAARIEKDVIPTLTEVTSKVADRKIAETLPQQLNASVASAMRSTLSGALQQALKDKEVHRTISEVTAKTVAQSVQQQVSTMLQQHLPGMAMQASQKMVGDLEKRVIQQQQQAETQRQRDNAKIAELSDVVRSLSTTVQNMAESQSAFQEQILRLQRENKGEDRPEPITAAISEAAAEPEDADVARMTQMLMDGQFEEVTIQWISSDRQAEIFDKLFIRVNPDYLQRVSPLVALTVSAAITSSMDTYVKPRLEWLGKVLQQIDMTDPDIRDVAPKIMDVLSQRLQAAYMQISEENPSDATLRTISALNRQVNEIRRLAA